MKRVSVCFKAAAWLIMMAIVPLYAMNDAQRLPTVSLDTKSLDDDARSRNKEIVKDLERAYAYAEQYVDKKRQDITLDTLLEIHRLLYQHSSPSAAGKLRAIQYSGDIKADNAAINLVGVAHYADIERLMNEFISWLHTTTLSAPEIAAQILLKIVKIHPFLDGNGRTARLLMNLVLAQDGYPPALLETTHNSDDRRVYLDKLNNALIYNDYDNYYAYILEAIERGKALIKK